MPPRRRPLQDDFRQAPASSGKSSSISGAAASQACSRRRKGSSLPRPSRARVARLLCRAETARRRWHRRQRPGENPTSAVLFTANPFRHVDSFFSVMSPGNSLRRASRSPSRSTKSESGRRSRTCSWRRCLCSAWPWAPFALDLCPRGPPPPPAPPSFPAGAGAGAHARPRCHGPRRRRPWYRPPGDGPRTGGRAHVPDELSSMFGPLLATGHFAARACLDSFSWSNPSPIVLHAGKSASDIRWPSADARHRLRGTSAIGHTALLGAPAFPRLPHRQANLPGRDGAPGALCSRVAVFLMTASNFMAHMTAASFCSRRWPAWCTRGEGQRP